MSAGVEGMTTVRPGTWASSASRLCECWLPEERPPPNWVLTPVHFRALPPVMNRSFAAWFSSWSKQTPRKSQVHQLDHWSQAVHRPAHRQAHDRGLGDRGVQ